MNRKLKLILILFLSGISTWAFYDFITELFDLGLNKIGLSNIIARSLAISLVSFVGLLFVLGKRPFRAIREVLE